MSQLTKVSTVPAARAWIVDGLTSLVTNEGYSDPGVTVFLGEQNSPEDANDFVVIGKHIVRTTDTHRMVGGGGLHWLREQYSVSVHINCADMHSNEFTKVDGRAYALLSLVEQVIRSDPSLGGLAIMAKPGHAQAESSFDSNHGGAICLIDSVVDVLAEV